MFNTNAKLNENNVTNYVNEWDAITMVNGQNHIGKIYAVKNLGNNPIQIHNAESMGKLTNREPRTASEIQKHKNIFNRIQNKTNYTSAQIKEKLNYVIEHIR